jgi:hypothetical protein
MVGNLLPEARRRIQLSAKGGRRAIFTRMRIKIFIEENSNPVRGTSFTPRHMIATSGGLAGSLPFAVNMSATDENRRATYDANAGDSAKYT